MKWIDKRPRRFCAAWLAAMALPAWGQAGATGAATDADEAAQRMARIQRVASDPMRRIQEAARLGGGVGRPGSAAAPTITVSVPSRRPASATATAGAPPATVHGSVLPDVPALPATLAAQERAAEQAATAAATATATATATAPSRSQPPQAIALATPPAAAATAVATPAPAEAALPLQAVSALPAVALARAQPAPEPALAPAYVPVLVQRVDPDFAGAAWGGGQALRFQLRFSIAADGSVQDLVVQGGGDRQLLRVVREAVSLWRYAPPGRPTPHTVELLVRFDT